MIPRLFRISCCLLCTVALARADYDLQRKSNYDTARVKRNIFWPIGYVHVENSTVVPTSVISRPPTPLLSVDQFVVSSILIGGGLPLAVINGQPRGVGEFLIVGGLSVEVIGISDGLVTLRYDKTAIRVPLKR